MLESGIAFQPLDDLLDWKHKHAYHKDFFYK